MFNTRAKPKPKPGASIPRGKEVFAGAPASTVAPADRVTISDPGGGEVRVIEPEAKPKNDPFNTTDERAESGKGKNHAKPKSPTPKAGLASRLGPLATKATAAAAVAAPAINAIADATRQDEDERDPSVTNARCLCPSNRARDGSICGNRSAFIRPGGEEPDCGGLETALAFLVTASDPNLKASSKHGAQVRESGLGMTAETVQGYLQGSVDHPGRPGNVGGAVGLFLGEDTGKTAADMVEAVENDDWGEFWRPILQPLANPLANVMEGLDTYDSGPNISQAQRDAETWDEFWAQDDIWGFEMSDGTRAPRLSGRGLRDWWSPENNSFTGVGDPGERVPRFSAAGLSEQWSPVFEALNTDNDRTDSERLALMIEGFGGTQENSQITARNVVANVADFEANMAERDRQRTAREIRERDDRLQAELREAEQRKAQAERVRELIQSTFPAGN